MKAPTKAPAEISLSSLLVNSLLKTLMLNLLNNDGAVPKLRCTQIAQAEADGGNEQKEDEGDGLLRPGLDPLFRFLIHGFKILDNDPSIRRGILWPQCQPRYRERSSSLRRPRTWP